MAPALDTVRSITTPEGIELELKLAGPVPRACAWAIDLAVRAGILIAISVVLGQLGKLGMGLMLICIFLVEWLYPAVCELKFDGATPGKKLMRLRVVNDDGTPVTLAAAVVRNLLRTVDFLPFMYGVGLASMLINREFRRLGDLVAQTVVVYRQEPRHAAAIPDAPPLAPPRPLTVEEAHAIVEFAERSRELTPERAAELASIVRNLTGASGPAARERLLRMANHLVGRSP
ncbi:MAG TPA: RDD family protein [Burkholderiales bacterium]|nr:RDD family protein [Burkholderiales bacterium]